MRSRSNAAKALTMIKNNRAIPLPDAALNRGPKTPSQCAARNADQSKLAGALSWPRTTPKGAQARGGAANKEYASADADASYAGCRVVGRISGMADYGQWRKSVIVKRLLGAAVL
jgi:hypothetical protein